MSAYGEMAFGGLVNAGSSIISNWLARQREQEARQENYKYGEMAAENANQRMINFYNTYQSPQAMLSQFNQAGLSPSLMFGGKGAGGATPISPAQGTGANGISPTTYSMNLLEGAQLELMRAQAEKTRAEAKTISGENERGMAEIAQTWADTGHKKVAASLLESEKTGVEWDNYIKSNTAEITINTAYALSEKAAYDAIKSSFEIISAQARAQVDEATIQAQIDQAIANVQFTDAQTLLTKSSTKLNEQKVQESIAIIEKWQKEVQIEWQKMTIDMYNASTERAKWRTMDQFYATQEHVLKRRLSFDEDSWSQSFIHTVVNDAAHNMQNSFNTFVNPINGLNTHVNPINGLK